MQTSGITRPSRPYLGQWYLTAIFIAVMLTIPGLGEKRFSTRGEPREALVMDNMLRSGNLVLPHGYGETVPSKPPLMHWIAVGLSYPGGEVTEFTARLPSALASIFFIVYFFRFVARRTSIKRALISSLILVSAFEWWRSAMVARVDMLLTILVALGLLELYRWRERALTGVPLGAVVALSGATLTKGPISLVLPGLIFGLFLLVTGVPFVKAAAKTTMVLVLSCLIPSVWYLAAYQLEPEAFAAKFYRENIARFLGKMAEEAHDHSIYYLFASLGYGLFPWSVPALLAAGPAILSAGGGDRDGETFRDRLSAVDRLNLFCAIAAAMIFLFFCFPTSKRGVYLLPSYPFIALIISQLFDKPSELRVRVAERILALGLSAAVLFTCLSFAAVLAAEPALQIAAGMINSDARLVFIDGVRSTPVFGTVIILAVIGVAATAVLIRTIHGRPYDSAFAVMWLMLLAGVGIVSSPFSNQMATDRFAEKIRPIVKGEPETMIYSFGKEYYGTSYYLHRQFGFFDIKAPQIGFVITAGNRVEAIDGALPKNLKYEKLAEAEYPDTKPSIFPVLLRVSPVDTATGSNPDKTRPKTSADSTERK